MGMSINHMFLTDINEYINKNYKSETENEAN